MKMTDRPDWLSVVASIVAVALMVGQIVYAISYSSDVADELEASAPAWPLLGAH